MRHALRLLNGEIAENLQGKHFTNQAELDQELIELDGTPNKSRLGGNSLIATSLAFAKAQAARQQLPLWQSLCTSTPAYLPIPEIQLFGGGAHAAGRIDIQDFMLIAVGAQTFGEALEWTAEVYRTAGELLRESGLLAGVAQEGRSIKKINSNEEALELSIRAIEAAGFKPGQDLAISLDVAASEFGQSGSYRLSRDQRVLNRTEMLELLKNWLKRYPIISLEDPLAEDDDWKAVLPALGSTVQVIGDDFLVTNASRVQQAATHQSCNALLVKPNQAGTLTETKAALDAAHAAGWQTVVSARSGETEDTTIADLSVGVSAGQIKTGSLSRTDRTAKYNQLLRIEEALQGKAKYAGSSILNNN